MNHDRFIDTLSEMGFDVEEQDPPKGEDRGVVTAENDNGDVLWWSVIDTPEVWGVYIEGDRVTLDDASYRWRELTAEDDALIIDHATGTRAADVGYGRRGFEGEVRINAYALTITETSRYTP